MKFVSKYSYINASTDDRNVILNYGKTFTLFRRKKRALLSYLTDPVIADSSGQKTTRFSNHGIAICWAKALVSLGFSVDIIDWDNDKPNLIGIYDIVVLHGGKNHSSLKRYINKKTFIIHFLTGSYWKYNNRKEDQRIDNFFKRNGIKLERDRYIYDSEDEVNESSNAIIVLGDKSMRQTYPKKYKNIYTINNASYPDNHFDIRPKDYKNVKKNFLYFAGSGNIHKGLDLCIEAFSKLKNQHLYIVGRTDMPIVEYYKNQLNQHNIHLVGEVNMRTEEFYKQMDKCAFAILPSCSEGQAGSIIECMNQGLIPIVSKETRLETGSFGFTLKDCEVNTIRSLIKDVSAMNDNAVKDMSLRSRETAIRDYRPKNFTNNLMVIIKNLHISKRKYFV